MGDIAPPKPEVRPLRQQIQEVEREIAMRDRVYPGFVHKGKMRQTEADEHMARIKAVKVTLEWLQLYEPVIRAAIRAHEAPHGSAEQ